MAGQKRDDDLLAARFEAQRPRLRAIAQRILGSANDAEDAVQETWLRFSRADTSDVENLGSWLTTVVSRVCLNMLQARRVRAQPALEPELPEPAAEDGESHPEQQAILADSIGLALMVVLDTLNPAERVAFVLHDVFGIAFDDIAPIVERSTPATRQLASRARARIRQENADGEVDRVRQATVVDAFLAAARHGDWEALLAVLDPDVVLRGDEHVVELGGPRERRGAREVAEFLRVARGAKRVLLDGAPAAVWLPGGRPRVVYLFTTSGQRITGVELVSDPERLGRIQLVAPDHPLA